MSYYKYPRTYHLPFSEGYTSDDKILKTDALFQNMDVVITEKMDGENTTIYKDFYHARSLDSKHKEYHSWLLGYMKQFQYLIPDDWRICGEYLYAKHSIKYNNLLSYFLVFSVWNENNDCLSWDDTETFCNELGLITVPVLYQGKYSTEIVKKIAKDTVLRGGEGIVVRNKDVFSYNSFSENIAKYVRKNHIQTDEHWSLCEIEKNLLKQ